VQKTAEPIEVQFQMPSRMGPENMYYMGYTDAPMGRETFRGV